MDDQLLSEKMKYSWPIVVSHCFKTSVISYRTALEFKPSPQNCIYLVSKSRKHVTIGGVEFKLIRGRVESSGNRKALMGANVSCKERAFLELLIRPRKVPQDDRYLDLEVIEEKLLEILDNEGEEGLNLFRDRAKDISIELNLSPSFKELSRIISTLLGSRSSSLKSPKAISRAGKLPVDTDRISLFLSLAAHMETITYPRILNQFETFEHIGNKAFFESYFSNYIEGTEFLIEEAEEIIFERKETETRYVLEEFDAQPTIGKSSGIVEKKVAEEEIQFELKTKTPQSEINEIETKSEEVSPLDLTITELQKRAEERRKKMKGFNYKFNDQMNKNIDEIERQPAYKRLGVDLDTNTISKAKTSIKKEDDDLGLKSNNSFLHDNVD